MKCVYVLCLCAIICKTGLSSNIVIHTMECCKLYNFFPLRTNILTFSVKSKNDVHISLTNGPQLSPPYYEIVLGGWSNSQSVIRKDNEHHQIEHKAAILKQDSFQTFVVYVDEERGRIEVGKRRGDPFMAFEDPDFVKMSYFGIATGFQSAGDWNFEFDNFYCACTGCNHTTQHQTLTKLP